MGCKRKRKTALFGAILMMATSLATWLADSSPADAAPAPGTDRTYTTDADFDQGTLVDANHTAPNNNQLQLNKTSTPFPFVNIAASARGTTVRIDVNTGSVTGEYRTAPDGMGRNPSRTTVDKFGNVWVANRDESAGGKGSVARIGLVTGGTRANADGTPNPAGQFVKPPFAYNTCVDRNSDNLIKTSSGLANILGWTNAGGADTDGGVSTAEDECVINYTRVTGTNTRTVAVDGDNDVWVGGFGDLDHEKLDGGTGQPVAGTQFNLGCGGYGGLIDPAGTLWSARGGSGLLRFNTGALSGACLGFSRGDYGLGLDPNTGEIWHTFLSGNAVMKLAPNGAVLGTFNHGNNNAQGVAVDKDGNVWVAHSLFGATTVGHLRTNGTFVGNVSLPGGNGPTGVAVDANGKVWVANINSNNAMRIDPNAGPIGGGGFPVGAVDKTVDLGAGAGPYNYSDMTGSVLGNITAPQGTWTVVQDGGVAGTKWGKVTWNTEPQGSEPPGTSITFEARVADTEAALSSQSFVPVSNGAPFSLTGRFIEVRATLKPNASGDSPVLSDVRIESTPELSIDDVTVTEGDAGTTPAGFTVSLSAPSSVPVTVDFATAPDTATAPADYVSTSGGLTFAPGETSKPITVPVNGDLTDEPNETFFVNLSNPSNAGIADGQGVGTIIDDDRNGKFSCRASALRLASNEPVVANAPNQPCKDDQKTVLNTRVKAGLLTVTASSLKASTDQTPNDLESAAPAAGDNGLAKASAAGVRLSGLLTSIRVGVADAQAKVECVPGPGGLTPKLTGSSTVSALVVGNTTIPVSGPVDIPVPGVGTLHVNHTIAGPNSVTQRAVWLEPGALSLVPELIVSEARANFTGNPCVQ